MAKKTAFCAKEQELFDHELSISGATQDIILTCSSCGHFFKVPNNIGKEEFNKFLKKHQKLNTRNLDDQIPVMSEDEKEQVLEDLI